MGLCAVIALAHPLADRGDDVYDTPEVAVEALLKVENLPRGVSEPACGPGAIVRVPPPARAAFELNHRTRREIA